MVSNLIDMIQDYEEQYYESEDFWKENLLDFTKQLNRIIETIQLITPDTRSILDVGCGNGALCNYLTENRPELKVVGLDRSRTALKYVKSEKKQGEINTIPFEDSSFDCVMCLQVLEHIKVPEYKTALQQLARVSDKYIIVSVPYKEKIDQNITKCPSCKSIFNYDLHLRSYEDESIKNLFSNFNFKLVKTKTIGSYELPRIYAYYLKLRNRKEKIKDYLDEFNSPICPICGYVNTKKVIKNVEPEQKEKQIESSEKKSIVHHLIKRIWTAIKPLMPVERHDGYWIVALYKKSI